MSDVNPFSTRNDDQFGKSGQDWDDVDRPSKWEYNDKDDEGNKVVSRERRILTNSFACGKIYIPVIDEIDGDLKEFRKPVGMQKAGMGFEVPKILQLLQEADLRVRRENSRDGLKVQSIFNLSTTFYYLAFLREDEETAIRLCEYGIQTKKGIAKISKDKHPKKTVKVGDKEVQALLNGPIYLYDTIITKKLEKGSKSKRTGTSYEVAADPDNIWRGKVPETALADGMPSNFKWVPTVYSEEEWDVIGAFLQEHKIKTFDDYLEQVYKESVVDEENVKEVLKKFNFEALDENENPLLPYKDKFIKAFNDLSGIKLIGGSVAVKEDVSKEEPEEGSIWEDDDGTVHIKGKIDVIGLDKEEDSEDSEEADWDWAGDK